MLDIKMQWGYVIGSEHNMDLYDSPDTVRIMHYSKDLETIQSLFKAYPENEDVICAPVYISTIVGSKSEKEEKVVCLNFRYSTSGKFATTHCNHLIKIFMNGKFDSQFICEKNLSKNSFAKKVEDALLLYL